jgi:hypothetical protein
VFFNKNSSNAGHQGSLLAEGTCAWVDRPIDSNEPSKLKFREQKWDLSLIPNPSFVWPSPSVPAFMNCNTDKRCTFGLRVYNDGNGYFVAGGSFQWMIWVYFPFR